MAQLKKEIGFITLVLLSINVILGTGIFFLPAIGAEKAGPASIISWVIMAVVAVVISTYFAQLVSMFPNAGGVYGFIKNSFGMFVSFLFGWTTWIIANITIAMLIIGSLLYLFPSASFLTYIILSFSLILLFSIISYRGIKYSASLLLFFGIATLLALLSIIIPGFFRLQPGNFSPFFVFPLSSIFVAIFFIAETFFGWETVTFFSEEVKNARKSIPKAIVLATIIISVVALSLVFVSLGSVNWKVFSGQTAPLAYLATVFFGTVYGKIFSVLFFIPLIGTAAGWIISSPRLLLAMSRDNLFIPQFKKIHPKHNIPHNAIIFQGIMSCFVVFLGFANYKVLLQMLLPLVLLIYSGVMLSFIKLSSKQGVKVYYKSSFGKPGAMILFLFNIWLIYLWLRFVPNAIEIFSLSMMIILLGFPIYILVRLQDKKFREGFFDSVSFVYGPLIHLWYGKSDRQIVISNARIKKNSLLLDYGCATGIDFPTIINSTGNGKIVAVDISNRQLNHSIKRIKKMKGMPNIIFIKEDQKIPFEKETFNSIISVGVLGYQKNPLSTIEFLRKIMKKGGTISILDFGRSFIFPAPKNFASRNKVISLFKKARFKNIRVHEKVKWFTRYYFVSAAK